MDMREFRQDYPHLSTALGGDFHDFDIDDEAALARRVRSDLKVIERIRFFKGLVEEAHRAVDNVDDVWKNISTEANRVLSDSASARAWLAIALREWEAELDRMLKIK